jgi:CHAT domain-containing protein/Tfp pilus assembly protein PilF
MRGRKRILSSTFLFLLVAYIFGQRGSGQELECMGPGESGRGIVVEKIAKGSTGEKAGMERGDILLKWQRVKTQADLASPFDLASLEAEQAPRGPVTICGARGSEKRRWVLGPDGWGILARPNFSEPLLALYAQGEALAQAKKWVEAAEQWRTVASQMDGSAPLPIRLWLLAQVADAFAQARQWKNVDEVYRQAIQEAGEPLSPAIPGQLLRAWADSFKLRSDWPNAEKYYQQSILEEQKLGSESLIIASTIDDLGTISGARGDLAKAEEYFRKALAIRQKLAPGSLEVAVSFIRLGDTVRQRGDLAKAEEYERQALEIGQKLAPGGLQVAGSANVLGILAAMRGDLEKAEEYLRQALEIRQKLTPGSLSTVNILNNLGYVAWHRGDLAKAGEYYGQVFEIRQKLAPGSLEVADSLNDVGAVAQERGDLAKAEEYWLQALDLRQKLAPGSLNVSASLNNLGNLARQRGELAKAEEYYRQSLQIRQKLAPGSLHVGDSLLNLGVLAEHRGDLAEAENYYRQALEIRQKLAPGSLDVADGLNNLGIVAERRADLTKAEEYYRQALEIRQKLAPGSLDVAENLDNLGNVVMQQGDLAKAEEYCRQGFEIRQKLAPDSLGVADSLTSLGDVAKQQGALTKAEQYYRQALEIRQKLAPQSGDFADSLAVLAEILRRQGQMDQAAQLYQQALDVLDKQMTMFGGSEETRSGFRSNHIDLYGAYIDLLVGQKQPEPAFHVLERSRAQGLLETLAAAGVDIRKGADPELIKKEHSLRELLAVKSNRRVQLLNDKSTEARAAALDKEIQETLKQYQEVEGQIRQASPGYAALTQPQPLTVKEVQQELLDKDTLLLEYTLWEQSSYVFAVTQDSVAAFPLPKRAEIDASAREVYRLLADRDAKDGIAKNALVTLSHQVLGPVGGQLNKKRLLVVSDGALQYIPFAILPTPEDPSVPLLVKHEVVNLPSASTLAVLRRQLSGRKAAPKAVAILADPVFDRHDDRLQPANKNDRSGSEAMPASWPSGLDRSAKEVGLDRGGSFPRLLFSRREANAIYSTARQGDAMKLLDFDASKDTAISPRLQDYRIVHYATHGLLNSEHPELSGLVFSLVNRQGNPQDGFLRLLDIYNLELNADLIVLSACQTALGKQIAGEGLIGLTRGFMYAGAPRVMASLWKVDDEATAELMKKFYEGMLRNGQTPAQSLRSSQIWMSQQKRWKGPYYWAGFVLQGEWK